jgi:SsrA-binding protein
MKGDGTITTNKKAFHDYSIENRIEAGLVLTGTEIKSVRKSMVNIRDSYARPQNSELWLLNAHIAPYKEGNRHNHEPTRSRKLLVHKKELQMLSTAVERKGLTLVPLKMYIKNGRAKIELGIAKGKKLHDKRKSIVKRETDREMEKAVKSVRR